MSIIRSAGIVAMLGAFLVPPSLSQILFLDLYTTREGMVANSAHTFLQDSHGYLWIGTGDGVSRYDGTSFQNFTVNDGLPLSLINCIAETPGSIPVVWVGTNGGGLGRIVGSNVSSVVLDTTQAANVVADLAVDASGVLWCATRAGIYTVAHDSIRSFLRFPGPDRSVSMVISGDQHLWLGLEDTILIYSLQHPQRERKEVALPEGSAVRAMYAARDGDTWVATQDGFVRRFRPSGMVHMRKITSSPIFHITEDHHGQMWIATGAGLLTVPKAQFTEAPVLRYGTGHGLPDSRLRSVYCDRENNLWIGSFTGGTIKWGHRGILTFPVENIPDAYNNGRAVVDSLGHFWVATRRTLVEIWKDPRTGWHRHEHTLIGHPTARPIRFIVLDRGGHLWVDLTGEGIRKYDIRHRAGAPSILRLLGTLREGEHLPADSRHSFLVDRNGLGWVGVQGTGVVVVDIVRSVPVKVYTEQEGSPGVSVRTLIEDADGNVWAGGFLHGVTIFPAGADGGKPARRLDEIVTLPDHHIRAFATDPQGRMWIGTRYGGLVSLEGNTMRTMGMKDGLVSNAIWALAAGTDNRIWCGTSLGLQGLDTETLKPLEGSIGSFGESVNSCGVYRDQFVWFIAPTGLVIHENLGSVIPVPPPLTHITRVQVNGATVDHDAMMEFPHTQNTFSIDYVGVSLRDEKQVRYRYRLLGVDREWNPSTSEHSVTYAALAPGRYTFEVHAFNAGASVEQSPARLSFTIHPPLWQRGWFLASTAALGAGFVAAMIRRRRKNARLEQERQVELSRQFVESQESERRRIANELHDSLGQELLVLKSDLQHLASRAGGNAEVAETLARLSEDVMQSINEVRQISYDLHPHVLERLGLRRAIESIATKTSESSGLHVDCTIDEIDDVLPKRMEINLYRIVQEGLSNIVKHAHASGAKLEIVRQDGSIAVRLQDNGRGFEPETHRTGATARQGLGLAGIAERARLIGGTWSVRSHPGQGTTLLVTIPTDRGKS